MNNYKKRLVQAAVACLLALSLATLVLLLTTRSRQLRAQGQMLTSFDGKTANAEIAHLPSAGPRPVVSNGPALIDALVEKSSVIAVAKVTQSPDIKAVAKANNLGKPNEEFQIDILPQATYKGDLSAHSTISVYFFLPKEAVGFVVPEREKTYTFFLERDKEGKLIFADLRAVGIAVLPQRPEVGRKVSPLEAVKLELLHNIREGDEFLIIDSLKNLDTSPESLIAARGLSDNPSLFVRAAAAAYRLRAKDVQAISEAVAVAEELNRPGDLKESSPRTELAIQDIAIVLPELSSAISPEQLMRLSKLRTQTTQDQRDIYANVDTMVGEVLRRIAVGEVKRPNKESFASVAMDVLLHSGDNDARYSALQLLSVIRNVKGPGIFEFVDNTQKYVAEYSAWWEKQGKARYAKS